MTLITGKTHSHEGFRKEHPKRRYQKGSKHGAEEKLKKMQVPKEKITVAENRPQKFSKECALQTEITPSEPFEKSWLTK